MLISTYERKLPRIKEVRIMFNKSLMTILVLGFITAFFWYANPAQAQATSNGLIGYWSFDKGTIKGEIVEDVWVGNDGTIKGDPQEADGKVGGCLEFDGDVDYVLVDSDKINIDYSEITMECWVFVKSLDDSWNRIISLEDTASGNKNVVSLYYDDDDNQHGFWITANGTACNAATDMIQEDIPLNEWIHLAGVFDGKKAKFYKNGELAKEYGLSGKVKGGGLFLGIGDRSDACNCDAVPGMIDEVRLYNRALTDREIKINSTAEGLAVTPSGFKVSLTWGRIKVSMVF